MLHSFRRLSKQRYVCDFGKFYIMAKFKPGSNSQIVQRCKRIENRISRVYGRLPRKRRLLI